MVDDSKIVMGDGSEATKYDLIDICFSEIIASPEPESKMSARPYEFQGEYATKYTSICPFCGQGVFIEVSDIESRYGFNFITCPECGAGRSKEESMPEFEDPFVNPVEAGNISDQDLDDSLINTLAELEDDGLTVAERMEQSEDSECEA